MWKVRCKEELFKEYARANECDTGRHWFGEKGKEGSFRFSGLGRSAFLAAAEMRAKGALKQLGALDGVLRVRVEHRALGRV